MRCATGCAGGSRFTASRFRRAVVASLRKPWMSGTRDLVATARSHPDAALGSLFLDTLLRDHMVGLSWNDRVLPDIIRLRDLATRWDQGTIALFATPTGSAADRALRPGADIAGSVP